MLLSFRNRLSRKKILLKITRKVTKDARTKPFSIYAIFLIICLFGTLTKKKRNFVFYTSIFVEVSVLCNVSQSSLYKKKMMYVLLNTCVSCQYILKYSTIFLPCLILQKEKVAFFTQNEVK